MSRLEHDRNGPQSTKVDAMPLPKLYLENLRRWSSARIAVGVCASALLAAFLIACEGEEGPVAETPGPDDFVDQPADVPAVPPEVEAALDEWPLPNGGYDNHRAASNATIDSSNVDQLEVAWSFPLEQAGDWGAAATNPLIADGRIYLQDLLSNVFVLDLETGDEIWRSMHESAAIGPNGVGIGWGRVYLQDGQNHIKALDIESGEELWETPLDSSTGSHQPQVYGGFVYTGTGAGAPNEGPEDASGRLSYIGGISGYAYGIDHDSGGIVWRFQVVEEGFWGNEEENGGGALWYPPGVDTERGVTYWGTGNPSPFPGTIEYPNASSRPGPNLYTNSVLALGGERGELLWGTQVKPHDLFDLDFQIGPILTTATVDGQERDIVLGAGKLGVVYAFDRESGEILWERPVGTHQNDTLQEIPEDEETWVYPGVWGGVESPPAYADGTMYVVTTNLPSPWTATGHDAETPGEAVASGESRTPLNEGTSQAYAINVDTGEVEWEQDFDTVSFAGMTVVNDLVFMSTLDGVMRALDRTSGDVVWEFQVPGGVIAWPAVAGDSIVWPVGLGREPQLLVLRLAE